MCRFFAYKIHNLHCLVLVEFQDMWNEIKSPEQSATTKKSTVVSTVRTVGLDRAVQKLLVLWSIVKDQIVAINEDIKTRLNGSQIILESDFKVRYCNILLDYNVAHLVFLIS